MPKSLCIKCGAIKDDAWAPCGTCLAAPQSDDELAASLALTEDHFGVATLQSFGNLIKSGQHPKLSEDTKAEFLRLVAESKQRTQAPEHAFATQPVLRFKPTGIQLFVRNVFSLVGLEFVIAFTTIGCTLGFLLQELPEKQEKFLLYCAITAAVLGTLVMPLIAWRKPESVPSYSWFMAGAYLAGFGAPLAYSIVKFVL